MSFLFGKALPDGRKRGYHPDPRRQWMGRGEKYDVSDDGEVLTKEQVLAELQQSCPDALAKFPAPDAFEFREHHPGQYALKVGNSVTKKSKKIGGVLWLDEREDQAFISNYKSMAANDAIRKIMDLYYSTAEDIPRTTYVKNAGCIQGDGVFGKLSNNGLITPFTLIVKALLRFILLHCGYAEEYKTFTNKKTRVGLKPLIRALKEIAKRTNAPGEGGAFNMAPSEDAADDNDEAAVKRRNNKRKESVDAEVDGGAPAKKIRTR